MTKTYNFTDRTSYLAWVKDWKTTYAENSIAIRKTKEEMKITSREGSAKASNLQARREYLRADQRRAIEDRHEAKKQAQSQWLAEQEARQAA